MTTIPSDRDAEVAPLDQRSAVGSSAELEGRDRASSNDSLRAPTGRRLRALSAMLRDPRTQPLGVTWKKGVSAFAISLLVASGWRSLASGSFDRYPDLIVGDAILRGDLVKVWDYAFLHGMVVGFALWLVASVVVGASLSLARGRRAEKRFDAVLAACALPAVYVVAKVLMGRAPDLRIDQVTELTIVACLSASTLVTASCAALRRPASIARGSRSFGGLLACSTLIPTFAALSTSSVAIACARLYPNAELWASADTLCRSAAIAFGCGSIVVAAIWLLLGSRYRALRTTLTWGLVIAQLALPIGFCAIIPPHVSDGERIEHMFAPTFAFTALLVVLVVGGSIWTLISGLTALRRRSLRLDPLIATPAVAAALALVIPNGRYLFAKDDYHQGENLVSAYLMLDHGKLPFADFVPPHGLVDSVGVVAGRVFFDDSVDVIVPGTLVVNCLLVIAAIAAFRRQFGVGLAAIVVFSMICDYYMAGHASRTLVTLIAVAAAIQLLLSKRYLTVVIGYLALGPILAFYSLPHGVAGAIAVLPFAAYAGLQAFRQNPRRTLIRVGAATLAIALVWIATPLGRVVFATAEYLFVQRTLNDVAWGGAWEPFAVPGGPGLATFEAIRWAFLGVFAIAVAVVVRSLLAKATGQKPPAKATAYALAAMLLIFLLLPYAAGRIAPNEFNKTGLLTLVTACYFLPLILLDLAPRRRLEISAFVLLFASFIANPSPVATWSKQPSTVVSLPPSKDRDLTSEWPRTGRSDMTPEQRHGIRQLSEAFDLYLEEDETFLDASNSNSFYYYLDRPAPLRNFAFLNSHATLDQLEGIERLERKPVPLLVVAGGGASISTPRVPLRTPLLFRYLLERYVPVPSGSHVYGVLPERLKKVQAEAPATEKSAEREYFLVADHDDQYWRDGVLAAFNEASVLVPNDSPNAIRLQPGNRVKIRRGEARTITRIEAAGPFIRVTFSGAKLDPAEYGFPHKMYFGNSKENAPNDRVGAWDNAWRIRDVGLLPTAWGRSFDTLRPLLIEKGEPFASSERSVKALSPTAENADRLIVGGDAPTCTWSFNEPIDGRQLGVLALNLRFSKADGSRWGQPVDCTVGWRHSDVEHAADRFTFKADYDKVLIPLDASHRWVLRDGITELWVSFEGLPAGIVAEVSDPQLYQRRDVEELQLVDQVDEWYLRDRSKDQ